MKNVLALYVYCVVLIEVSNQLWDEYKDRLFWSDQKTSLSNRCGKTLEQLFTTFFTRGTLATFKKMSRYDDTINVN